MNLLPFVVITTGIASALVVGVVLGLMWAQYDTGAEESRPQPAPHAVASSSNIVELFAERVEA